MKILPKNFVQNEKGLIHLIVIIIILLALGLGVYLVQTRTNINPFAQSLSAPISGPIGMDSDKDGFTDNQETFMGTNPNSACPASLTDNAWPVDVNNDKGINGSDTSTLIPYISGEVAYNKRYDLNQDNRINESDVSVIQAYFLKTCEAVQKNAILRMGSNYKVEVGTEIAVPVFISSTELVNLVSAQITYPADKLEVVNLATDTVNFNYTVEKYAENGQISIILGSTNGVKTSDSNIGITIAKIQFRTKAAGIAGVNFNKATSEILRLSDGENILNTERSTDTSITIGNLVSPTPASTPSVTPTPVVIPTPMATPTPVSTPSINPTPIANCVISKAEWIVPVNPAQANTTAGLRVEATGDCTNKQVSFIVVEDDGILGSDDVKLVPQPIVLLSNPQQNNFVGTATWITEFQEDGVFGSSYPPEFKFTARLDNTGIVSNNLLQVLRTIGTPSPVKGDVNGDGKANLRDISNLLASLTKNEKPSDLLDIKEDGELNTGDFSALISILKQNGVLRQ
jgi:hypothetical protein